MAYHLPTILLSGGEMGFKARKVIINVAIAIVPNRLSICLFAWGYDAYVDYQRKYYFTDNDKIERITGVRFPDMEIIEYSEGKRGFTGDYSDRLIVEFEEVPAEKVYQTLDSLVDTGKTGWRMNDSAYVFSATWGNGMLAPKGESDNEDRSFGISFSKGSKKAMIHSGMW